MSVRDELNRLRRPRVSTIMNVRASTVRVGAS